MYWNNKIEQLILTLTLLSLSNIGKQEGKEKKMKGRGTK